jgi:hypothetical protein
MTDGIENDMRNEIISQFTSKMSETAISMRKLEQLGFKGKKLENFVDRSALKIRQDNSVEPPPREETPVESSVHIEEVDPQKSPAKQITRFMTEKEKNDIWIEQQRQSIIE